jgi:hypothetical protein
MEAVLIAGLSSFSARVLLGSLARQSKGDQERGLKQSLGPRQRASLGSRQRCFEQCWIKLRGTFCLTMHVSNDSLLCCCVFAHRDNLFLQHAHFDLRVCGAKHHCFASQTL